MSQSTKQICLVFAPTNYFPYYTIRRPSMSWTLKDLRVFCRSGVVKHNVKYSSLDVGRVQIPAEGLWSCNSLVIGSSWEFSLKNFLGFFKGRGFQRQKNYVFKAGNGVWHIVVQALSLVAFLAGVVTSLYCQHRIINPPQKVGTLPCRSFSWTPLNNKQLWTIKIWIWLES